MRRKRLYNKDSHRVLALATLLHDPEEEKRVTTTHDTELLPLGTVDEVEEFDTSSRYAARRIVAARSGDLHRRMILTRAAGIGEAHRRSESQEGPCLSDSE